MRKLFFLPLLLAVVMVFSISCKKESVQNTEISKPVETIAVKIAPDQTYTLNFPDAENLTIIRQAVHFLVSEAQVDAEGSKPVYTYIPAAAYTGSDEVLLRSAKTNTSSSGACNTGSAGTKTTMEYSYTTLKISVGD